MLMDKRTERLPIILATEAQDKKIRDFCYKHQVAFSSYALAAVLDRMERDEKERPKTPVKSNWRAA